MRRRHDGSADMMAAEDRQGGISRQRVDERLDEVLEEGYGKVEILIKRGKISAIYTTKTDISD